MFIKLTHTDGSIIRINPNAIEAYGEDDANGAKSFISMHDSNYQVKETVEEIDGKINAVTMLDNINKLTDEEFAIYKDRIEELAKTPPIGGTWK